MRIWLMKMTMRVRALDVAGELAQRLRHEARLQADVRVAHLAFDLGLGRQRRDRVDDDDVDRAGAHQHVGDLERLLAGVRLRDQQILHVHAELRGVDRIERVLGVDERRGAAGALRFGDHLQASASSCPRTPGRRSRRRGRAAGRRRRARCRGRASRSTRPRRRRSRSASPRRMTEPLPNCFSIWPSAAASAFLRFSSIWFEPR